jgi:hypothetical protein
VADVPRPDLHGERPPLFWRGERKHPGENLVRLHGVNLEQTKAKPAAAVRLAA